MRRILGGICVLLMTLLHPVSAFPQADRAGAGVEFLKTKVNPDGSIAGFSAIGGTADGVYALVAAGLNPNLWPQASGPRPIAFLQDVADDNTSGSGDVRDDAARAAKVAIAASLAGANPHSFGGADLIAFINNHYNSSTGRYGTDNFDQAFALLALRAAGDPVPSAAVNALMSSQVAGGGWEFQSGFGADTNTTSLAIQALIGAQPVTSTQASQIQAARNSALAFFANEQNSDAGFAYQGAFASNFCGGTNPSDANSTAYSIAAIRGAGDNPESAAWQRGSATPLSLLASLQGPNGSFSYQDGPDCKNDPGATSQAIPGIVQKSFLCLIGAAACPAAASGGSSGGGQPGGGSSAPSPPQASPAMKTSPKVSKKASAVPSSLPIAAAEASPLPSPETTPSRAPIEDSDPSADATLASPLSKDQDESPRASLAKDQDESPRASLAFIAFAALGAGALAALWFASRRKRAE